MRSQQDAGTDSRREGDGEVGRDARLAPTGRSAAGTSAPEAGAGAEAEDLSWLLTHDQVTGTYNTLYLLNRLERLRRSSNPRDYARRAGANFDELGDPRSLRVVYCNIEQFKEFNAIFGIEEGNSCLREVAKTLCDAFQTSYVSRFSADHFVVFYGRDDVDERIGRAHRQVAMLRGDFKLWLEAGVCEPTPDQTLSQACDLAKVACDQIRHDGTEYLAYYTGKIEEELKRKKYLQDHIQDAIASGNVQVWYQPVMRALTGRMAGAEALSRWIDPTYGNVPPSVFVPALEERHLSWFLLQHVVEEVCSSLSRRIEAGLPVVPVSVNVSRTDFVSCDPYAVIEGACARYNVPDHLVCVEITETVAMTDPESIERAVSKFRAAGHEVWMDDFGSAYSSLNTLKDFTFDKIKLDMLFLQNFNQRAQDIVRSVIGMAKQLGMHTLAEGVESRDQVEFLKEAGCEQIQGFYYSKPLPLDDLTEFMGRTATETPELRRLYDTIGLLKIQENEAAGFVFYDGQSFRLVSANARLTHQLESEGMYTRSDVEAFLNTRGKRFGQLLAQVADQAVETGASVLLPVGVADRAYRIDVRSVAPYKGGHMLLVRPVDVTAYAQEQRNAAKVEAAAETPDQALVRDERSQGDLLPFAPLPKSTNVVWSPITHTDRDGLEALSALMGIFISLVIIDLERWRIRPITIPTVSMDFLSGQDQDYRELEPIYVRRSVARPYREEMHRFIDPNTIVERLTRYGTVSLDYVGEHLGWCRLFLIPYASRPDGTVTKCLFAAQDINAEKARESRMSYDITHDPLTHALNRNGLNYATDMARGYTGQLAYVMLDIDNFKHFNDTYGHVSGDRILRRLARMLIDSFGTSDYVARIGGDEFVVLLTRYDEDRDGSSIRQRLRRINEALAKDSLDQGDVVSTSAGIVISTAGWRDDLYALADEALYATKASGKAGSQVRIVHGSLE